MLTRTSAGQTLAAASLAQMAKLIGNNAGSDLKITTPTTSIKTLPYAHVCVKAGMLSRIIPESKRSNPGAACRPRRHGVSSATEAVSLAAACPPGASSTSHAREVASPYCSVPFLGRMWGFLHQDLLVPVLPTGRHSLGCEGASMFFWRPALEMCQLPAFHLMPLFAHCPYSGTLTNPTPKGTLLRQLKASSF